MSDLLKQAIADAKAVRATALSNAKAALEEHFAPKLQSMLSEKLKAEMAEAEEAEGAEEALPVADVNVDVDAAPAPEAPVAGAEEAPAEAPVGSDNPEAPIDGQAPVEQPAIQDEQPAIEEEGEMEEDTFRGTDSAELDPTMRSTAPLQEDERTASSDYKKTTSGAKTVNKGQETIKIASLKTPGGPKAVSDSSKASSNYKTMPKGNDIKNIKPLEDPQGPSSEVTDGLKKDDKNGTSALKENDEVDETSLDEILKELEQSVNGEDNLPDEKECATQAAPEAEEEINLDEILAEADKDDEKDEDKGDDEEKDEEDDKDSKKPEWLKENISLKKELAEYRSAVVYLRDRINEVNLLNAKLLYTNKLFKQTSLTNEQKLKVIESFDLTKSVREAKLIYATLAESFNFGVKKAVVPVKKQVSSTVKTITEGLASKVIASTKPTKATVLTEGTAMANRFKKLAGIRQ